MRDTDLFQLALGITSPWFVTAADFDAAKKRLDIRVDFKVGSRFACPDCKADGRPVHDTTEKTWRHLDFFQHQAFLTARVPRVTCPECGVRQVDVPWARKGSGFTLLFEALAMTLITHMPVAAAARLVGEHDTRLWRIVFHYVAEAVARMDLSNLRRVCIDETAARRGHDYISIFVDMDERRVVFVTDGRDAGTIEQFADHVDAHNCDASRIKQVCIDMSGAFIKGVTENLTEAEITFDKLHAVKLVNDAVDKARRAESKGRPELKRSRYLWLRNEPSLSAESRATLATLTRLHLKTARAYQIRLAFQEVYQQPSRPWGELLLDRWYSWAIRSRLDPIKDAARTVMKHRDGVLSWFDSGIANGLIEGINSLVQAAKAKARGCRSTRTLKAITYLIAGKLDLTLPT
ncbi:MAG: ISL3 family transposase [Hyphomicrobiaceae bacterium]|nr:ISL3 family transposase [Hyphomicrobiaceae bacterium]